MYYSVVALAKIFRLTKPVEIRMYIHYNGLILTRDLFTSNAIKLVQILMITLKTFSRLKPRL